jgi:hypothetical protein
MRWLTLPNQKQNKYKNKKVTVNGKVFDSKKEAKRYCELINMQQAGLIKDLETQKKFILLDTFKKNGKTYRQISYYADFVYFDIYSKKTIVEDVKASKYFTTDVYKLKKKLFEYKYPDLTIKEIY